MPYTTEQLKEDVFILSKMQNAVSSANIAVTEYFYAPVACTIIGATISGPTAGSALVKRSSTTILTLPAPVANVAAWVTSGEAAGALTVDAGETLNIALTTVTTGSANFVTVWAKRRLA